VREWYKGIGGNTGLQIHGKKPSGIHCGLLP